MGLRSCAFVLSTAVMSGGLGAQIWQPSPGHTQVRIWPGTVPDARRETGPETSIVSGSNFLVAGKPAIGVGHVSQPTMTVYAPTSKNTGAAVIVFPGGGYQELAIDLEGSEVCDWLTAKGVTCVLLKYRVPGDGVLPKSGPYPESAEALDDAQRTIRLVRFHAADWHVNPQKIGVLGFSAGGHLAVATSVYFNKQIYRRVDAADDVSSRPDFAVPIYPGHLNLEAAEWDAEHGRNKVTVHAVPGGINDKQLALNPAIPVFREVPPTFLLQNEDDNVDSVYDALSYFIALQRAGVPAELHVYPHGGHAFGLRRTNMPVTAWPNLVESWLKSLGVLP